MTLVPPNGELVAQAWVAKYVGFPAAQIAATLPKPDKWTANGFLTVRALAAGTPMPELAQRRGTVVQLDAWAASPNTVRPLWGVALTMLERVRVATFRDNQAYGKSLEMPVSGFQAARVFAAYLTREPVRVEGDPSAYAHMTCDLAVDWTV